VQDAYETLYGVRWEERLSLEAMPADRARLKHREWENEIDARIINIRAERKGEGQTLTPKNARALSGQWYCWFTERHLKRPMLATHWEEHRERINDTLRDEVLQYAEHDDDEIDDILERSEAARADVRPIFADLGETAQFLAATRMVLDAPSRELFLDNMYHDFGEALRLLIKRAQRDWTPDTYPLQFPKFEETHDAGQGPWKLFELWVEAVKPAASTVDRWRGVFLQLNSDFTGRTAGSITTDEAQEWADKLINDERSAATVSDVWVVAARTVWAWAITRKYIERNPFKDVRITVRRKKRARGHKAFTPSEAKTILAASLSIRDTIRASAAARRWVPWLCAYTGARVGEITQLRGADVVGEDGVWAIHITPDAGTVKTRQGRTVPLHEHLIAQGFLKFASARGKGPLFYIKAKGTPRVNVATNPLKPRYVKTREHLADWVRKALGVTDEEIRPNHAWRHMFKQVASRHGITDGMSDYITGHAPASVARGYGAPTLKDMAAALKKFPRYEVERPARRMADDGRRREQRPTTGRPHGNEN
jgi:integrase